MRLSWDEIRSRAAAAAWVVSVVLAASSAVPAIAQGPVVTRGKPADVGMSAGVLAGGVALYEEAIAP